MRFLEQEIDSTLQYGSRPEQFLPPTASMRQFLEIIAVEEEQGLHLLAASEDTSRAQRKTTKALRAHDEAEYSGIISASLIPMLEKIDEAQPLKPRDQARLQACDKMLDRLISLHSNAIGYLQHECDFHHMLTANAAANQTQFLSKTMGDDIPDEVLKDAIIYHAENMIGIYEAIKSHISLHLPPKEKAADPSSGRLA